ncbi:hypothetical protein Tco_0173302, partial [Tanacetum coccineum]
SITTPSFSILLDQIPPLPFLLAYSQSLTTPTAFLIFDQIMVNKLISGRMAESENLSPQQPPQRIQAVLRFCDDDTFNFSMRGLPRPASWLGSHSESAIAAMAGIVPSTNARFYAIVKPLYDELRPDSWLWMRAFSLYFSGFLVLDGSEVNFSSDGARNYVQNVTEALHSSVHFEASIILQSRNPFVEYAVQYAIAVAYATLGNDNKELLQKLLSHGRDSLWFIRTTDRYLIIDTMIFDLQLKAVKLHDQVTRHVMQ